MKNSKNIIMKQFAILIAIMTFISANARERQGAEVSGGNESHKLLQTTKVMDACKGAKGSQELWVNNVRTIIFTAGDMWWDLFGDGNAYYIVPGVADKKTGISSNFGGSIWIGGFDAGGQLKVAAMTYRQTGYDFWPGPLNPATASTDVSICNDYDRIFRMTRKEVEDQVYNGNITDNIRNWPGNGIKNDYPLLAPFKDIDGDNFYDPTLGDYPYYDIYNKADKDALGVCAAKIFGDETLWWVFNDKGDIHTETSGQSIGLEIRGQAFAFKTNDEINNMTFYNYEVINRSTFSLNKTYFTVWNDPDLGCYLDDYVGCDIQRGLGFIYNATGVDKLSCSGTNAYGDFPPALGCDFFKGPLADYNPVTGLGDGVDNDFDGLTDEIGETIGMAKFMYYNNNIGSFPPQTTNPGLASHYYNYMTGFWKDGSAFTQGGNAYGGATPTNYVYPGDLYPTPVGWNEFTAGNLPGDRRFLQSAGPFTLKPGAINNVTFGIPWAQTPIKNGNLFSTALLKIADDKAQALFDNCFKILDGPEAPDLTVQEMENKLMIYLTNKSTSNNFLNNYSEKDVTILPIVGQTLTCLANPDPYYRFEGYKVYQLKDASVSQTDIEDETKAKLVFQSDVKNGITRLVNYNYDATIGSDVPKVKVEGSDGGITTTFEFTEDQFATGNNKKIVNNKTYYFMAFAYAYNNYATYKPDTDPSSCSTPSFYGQKRPYLEGRKIKKAAGIPHNTDFEKDGTVYQSNYGYGPKIKRIEGQGNGGNSLDLTDETTSKIVANGFEKNPVYENGRGPIKVKVVDPLNIPNSTFTVKFMKVPLILSSGTLTPLTYSINLTPTATPIPWTTNSTLTPSYNYTRQVATASALRADSVTWLLTNVNTSETYFPHKSIKIGEEYYFDKIGMSVTIEQVYDPGATSISTAVAVYQAGDFIEASMTFADPQKQWLTGLADTDGDEAANWIRSGSKVTTPTASVFDDYTQDLDKVFAKVLNGTWAPYNLCSATKSSGSTISVPAGPAYLGSYFAGPDADKPQDADPRLVSSVDVVFTPDQSKWTRCVVLEMQDDSLLSENVTRHFGLRDHASIDKNGVAATTTVGSTNPSDPNYISGKSMSWFPGYAINVETGERLNMAFGEDSYNYSDNGNDMKWNPTYRKNTGTYDNSFGGRHYIYVFGHNKDALYSGTLTINSNPSIASLSLTTLGAGRYDAGKAIYTQMEMFSRLNSNAVNPVKAYSAPMQNVMRDAMWVNIPLLTSPEYSFTDPKNMPCEVKVRLRVKKPFRYGYSTEWSDRYPEAANYIGGANPHYLVNTPTANLPKDTSATPLNNNMPMYEFSTADIYTMIGDAQTVKNAMDRIRIVPNPYYGYSSYETKNLDNRIRICNLPSNCTINIFTMNGTLVRTFKRDVSGQEDAVLENGGNIQSKRAPSLDWDLKNQSGIPVASGLYIFHINGPGDVEKKLKGCGVMRPRDIQNY